MKGTGKKYTRREFLKTTAAGAGLTIAAVMTPSGFRLLSAAELAQDLTFKPNAYLRIAPDDSITVVVSKSEMGQGITTSLPMIIADELEADWKQVSFVFAPASDEYKDPVWGMQSTGGSTSIRHMHDTLRKAGAAAREMLIVAGSEALKAPLRECAAMNGAVRHMKTGKGLTYGKLVFEASRLQVPQNPTLKKEGQFKYMGKAMPRLDALEKSTGRALFGLDTIVPGMLYAVMARPPQYGAETASFDQAAAKQVKGVQAVVPGPRGVAVCADTLDAAWKGRNALNIKWQNATSPALDTASLEKDMAARIGEQGLVAASRGDAKAALTGAAKKVEAAYRTPYLSHATMEPMNCAASVTAERCDVWVPTQNQGGVKGMAVKATGLKPEQIFVHTT